MNFLKTLKNYVVNVLLLDHPFLVATETVPFGPPPIHFLICILPRVVENVQ